MAWLYRWSLAHPLATMLLAAGVVLAAGPGWLRLELRTDGYALVPRDRPEVQLDSEIRAQFDVRDILIVLLTRDEPGGVYDADTVALIARLTKQLIDRPGIEPQHVTSLATETSHRVRPGTLDFRRFLDPLPTTAGELAQLRADVGRIDLHTGTIVSADGRGAAILVGVPPQCDRTELYADVVRLVNESAQPGVHLDVIGAPVAESLLGLHILEDLGIPPALLGIPSTRDTEAATVGPGDSARPSGATVLARARRVTRTVGLVPLALLAMLLVFAISFRSLPAALLPLMEAGACLAFVFGVMGLAGVPIYLTIAVMPIILTAIGVADEIHIFGRYVQNLRAQPAADRVDVLRTTLDEMHRPVVKTSVTTAVGFLSFTFSPLPAVQAFGLLTALGIMFCMLWSLTVIPALLSWMPAGWFVRRRAGSARAWLASALSPIAQLATGPARWGVLIAAAVGLALCPLGVRRIVVQDSWIDGFAPDSRFYQATQRFNADFLGSHLLLLRLAGGEAGSHAWTIPASAVDHRGITVPAGGISDPDALIDARVAIARPGRLAADDPLPALSRSTDVWSGRVTAVEPVAGDRLRLTVQPRGGSPVLRLRLQPSEEVACEVRPEPFTQPDVLRTLAAFEAFVAGQRAHTVGGVLGPVAYLETTHYMAQGLNPQAKRIPAWPDQILGVWDNYERLRSPARRQQVVDNRYENALLTVFMNSANFVDVGALLADLRDWEAQHLAPQGLALSVAGDVAVSQTVIDAIVSTQRTSLIASLIGITLITALLGRSLRWGLLCVLPCAAAVLVNFAVMGVVGVPLGVATSMFAGMTLGIGVDYAIHLLERYRHVRRQGESIRAAARDAVTVTGPAIIIDGLGVALGFGLLTLSQVPANARLGALLVLSIAGCLLATLVVLPALLTVGSRSAPAITPAETRP